MFSTDITSLQQDIDSFTIWCTANYLSVNHDKCSLIVFKGNFPRHVMVNNQGITVPNVVEDLGLLASDDLNWMTQINNRLLSCKTSLLFIKRNFPFTVSQSTKLMFVIYMCNRSEIFYASHFWFPSLCYIRKLESFNQKCLKWVIGSMPYQDQLFLTKTLPIYYNNFFNDVLLFYKMLHGLTELPFSACFF